MKTARPLVMRTPAFYESIKEEATEDNQEAPSEEEVDPQEEIPTSRDVHQSNPNASIAPG